MTMNDYKNGNARNQRSESRAYENARRDARRKINARKKNDDRAFWIMSVALGILIFFGWVFSVQGQCQYSGCDAKAQMDSQYCCQHQKSRYHEHKRASRNSTVASNVYEKIVCDEEAY